MSLRASGVSRRLINAVSLVCLEVLLRLALLWGAALLVISVTTASALSIALRDSIFNIGILAHKIQISRLLQMLGSDQS